MRNFKLLAKLRTKLSLVAKPVRPSENSPEEPQKNLQVDSDFQPLTPMQYNYWAAWKFRPDIAAGNRILKAEWHIHLDAAAFERALQALVGRTDLLRMVIREKAGEPYQRALDHVDAELQIRDFSGEPNAYAAANEWLDALARQRLNIDQRVFQTALAQIATDHWVWYINQHHSVTDYTSTKLIVERLSELYEAEIDGKSLSSEPFPSYLDFLRSNPDFVTPAKDKNPATNEPASLSRLYGADWDRRVEDAPNTHMISYEMHLGGERLVKTNARVQQIFGQQSHGVLLDLYIASMVVLIAHTTGQNTVNIGTTNHNRFLEGSDQVAGLFFRVMGLNFEIGEDWALLDLLQVVHSQRRQVFSALRNGAPLPDHRHKVSVNYIAKGMPDFVDAPTRDITETSTNEIIGLDLNLTIRTADTPGDIKLLFSVNSDIAEIAGVEDVAAHFLSIFDTMLENPNTQIKVVSLGGSEAKRKAEKRAACAMAAPPPPYRSIPEGFIKMVKQQPEAVAISQGDETMTYAQLEECSRAVALALRERGARPNDIVAVYLPRSIDLVVALLGVMRSGASFYALDMALPEERARVMLADTQAEIAITEKGEAPIGASEKIVPVAFDALCTQKLNQEKNALEQIDPITPMYVMYTSGSTGIPKGIVIPHESFARDIHWKQCEFGLDRRIDWAFASTLTFESPLLSFTSLVSGGSIRVYGEPKNIRNLTLVDILRDDQVSSITTTPSELRLLVKRSWPVSHLRSLLVTGEPLPRELALAAQKSLGPSVSVENWYGPTEATMTSTMHRFDADKDHGATVPIGHPAPDVSIHVLDQGMNPVPAGVIGEIYIGGARLSNGYLNRPELTEQRFIPDPFLANQRLYRTGDLGRFNRRGELVHHGRTDDQVKINGVRIELAEVECALLTHPRIAACVAALTKDDPPRLAAWFVADADIPIAELRSAVAQHLSSAMIPTLFSRIEAIPLNSNGKVDREALPPIQAGTQQDIKVIAPRTKTEKAIAEIWCDILNIEEIGVDNNFTLLGGDSLAMIKMVLAVEEKLDVSLSINSLNQIDTIAKLAGFIDGEHLTTDASSDVDFDQQDHGLSHELLRQLKIISIGWQGKSSSPTVPIFLLNSQGHLPPLFWCFNSAHELPGMAKELGSNQPIYGMRSLNKVIKDRQERRDIAPFLAQFYAREIQRLYPEGPYLLGGNCQGGYIATKIAQALIDDGVPVLLLCLLDFAPTTAYPGNVSLFFGRESERYNPFFKNDTPETDWKKLYGGVTWDIISGNHGRYFYKPNITPFCKQLMTRIREAHDG